MNRNVTGQIIIATSSLTLDGSSFTLSADPTRGAYPLIKATDQTRVTIQYLSIDGADIGVSFNHIEIGQVRGTIFTHTRVAVDINDTDGADVENSTDTGTDPHANTVGVSIVNSTGTHVIENHFIGLGTGVFVSGAFEYTLHQNMVMDSGIGFDIYSSSSASVWQNLFYRNGIPARATDDSTGRFFVPGLGGNYWDTFDQPSEGCVDGNGNGFCDQPYIVNRSEQLFDNLPYATTTPDATTTCTDHCISSVLFIPGIEGSRLYDGDETKLWEPVTGLIDVAEGADHVRKLYLNENGKSVDSGIHVKEGDVIDEAGETDIYGSFEQALDSWKSAGIISDWKAAAYDWRLSLEDILDNGTDADGDISYTSPTDTPYLIQTLSELAAKSASGKVIIIAHSNGGLVAKALVEKLGEDAPKLINKIVLAAVPQDGAPEALGDILFGQDFTTLIGGLIPFRYLPKPVTRDFALNSPMAYHLLPSAAYFASLSDLDHSVARFSGIHAYAAERSAFGEAIDNWQELADFVTGSENRTTPADSDVSSPAIGNYKLTLYAKQKHSALDSWTPPTGIKVYQIAGWGIDSTIAGIDFYEEPENILGITLPGYKAMYRPVFTENGDGTVPVPSALLMSTSSPNIEDYWINLKQSNDERNETREHGGILGEIGTLGLLKKILSGNDSELPKYVSQQPFTSNQEDKLIFILHSPLTLGAYDQHGNYTGINDDGLAINDIPSATYGEFGEVKYIIVPADGDYRIALSGLGSGTFSLDIQKQSEKAVNKTTTFADVPTTAETTAQLIVTNGGSSISPLTVDENGDGSTDITLNATDGGTVVYTLPQAATSTSRKKENLLKFPKLPRLPQLNVKLPVIRVPKIRPPKMKL
jgi:pimeloyl-ACP methyl ester carboxylesterase